MNFILYEYQKHTVKHIINNPSCGIFLDMGMGKTLCTLVSVKKLLKNKVVKKILIIAPLRVAQNVWSDEIQKWNFFTDLRFCKVLGPEGVRIKSLNCAADIYIINKENVVWLVNYFANSSFPFDMLVIDELSSFKNPASRRFKALKTILPQAKRIVGLTGTPAPNGLLDLWAQVYLLDQGKRLGKNYFIFRNCYFYPKIRRGKFAFDWQLKWNSQKLIYEKINDICMSLVADDYLKLPEKIEVVKFVKLPLPAMKIYKELEKNSFMERNNNEGNVSSFGAFYSRLLQIANGACYSVEKKFEVIHNAKLEELRSIIEESGGKPLLIFYCFLHDKIRILDYFCNIKIRVLASEEDVRLWNAGKVQAMLAHPASMGYGLNLQFGGSSICWFGLTWSLELYKQANGRLHRLNQKNVVVISHIVSKGTVDEDVMKALKNKEMKQKVLVDLLKARIKIK